MLTTLALAAAPAIVTLLPTPPAEATVAASAGVADAGTPVRITTADKLSLDGTYFEPDSRGGKAPGALVVHDAGANREQGEEIAKYLHRKGFGVLLFDLRGHGERPSGEKWAEADDPGRERMWAFAGRDLEAAAAFLRAQRAVHAASLSLVGIGRGGVLALRHAASDENARAVVMIAPQLENYGFDIVQGVGKLEGLPALIVAPKDGRDTAVRLQEAGHRANNGYEYIDVVVMKEPSEKVLEDRRLRGEVAQWLAVAVKGKLSK